MAITGYFIDLNWQYREILLGFEHLHGTHSGLNLSVVLWDVLRKHQIEDRVLAVTTDNASNNSTLVSNLQDSVQSLATDFRPAVIRVPCVAHVIQLALKHLLALCLLPGKKKEYYKRTYCDQGFLYSTGSLLATQYKLSAFDDREYSTYYKDTSKRYCEYLRTCFTEYQQQNPELLFRTVHRSSTLHSSELDRLLEPADDCMLHEGAEHNEQMPLCHHGSTRESISVNSQCFLGLHATCFRFRHRRGRRKGFSIARETSATIVEDLFMKRLFKT
ncbi:uncharacterized protein N7477_009040 [Penicillium maclennaniae]|uniref:uncharacterized protein n=1 Tax=Penicillium maclennaniae TaxID=1343394 RepID=UPI0025408C82|nr:uncharacterized protein N7477_009040 [Penicillium maclennaniae]KAJ5661424.1 hypothetical protein N7477_009040 [Penicillium maclennaniae]